ncbi:MAG: RecR, partial [uncultured Chloroflexia bacterium]
SWRRIRRWKATRRRSTLPARSCRSASRSRAWRVVYLSAATSSTPTRSLSAAHWRTGAKC